MSTKAGEPRQDFPQAAVREVRVITSSAPAEFGGRAGGVVSVVTRGGTNVFSGEAYEYFRNKTMQRLDPLTAADPRGEKPARSSDTSRHQFGGALGGPIIRDRLHFFVAAEQTSEDEPYRVQTGRPDFYGKYEGVFPDTRRDRLFFIRGDMQLNASQNAFARWAYQGNWNPCEGCGGAAYQAKRHLHSARGARGRPHVGDGHPLPERVPLPVGRPEPVPGADTGRRSGRTTRTSDPSGSSICSSSSSSRASVTAPDTDFFVHHAPVKPEFRNDFSISTSLTTSSWAARTRT